MSGYNWGKPLVGDEVKSARRLAIDRALTKANEAMLSTLHIPFASVAIASAFLSSINNIAAMNKAASNPMRDYSGHKAMRALLTGDTQGLTQVNVRTESTSDANREGEVRK